MDECCEDHRDDYLFASWRDTRVIAPSLQEMECRSLNAIRRMAKALRPGETLTIERHDPRVGDGRLFTVTVPLRGDDG